MKPLHPAQLSVLRILTAINAAVLLIGVIVGDLTLLRQTIVPLGLASALAAVLLLLVVIFGTRRRYDSWGYDMGADELHVQHGLWTRTRTVVPFGRVQHIDVAQGPIERRYGVGTLILHTAGTRSSAVSLPGLAFAEAEAMRDQIRGKIRQELA